MQKTQRFVADQRFDLPFYNSMINLISEEFHNYYKEFVTTDNYVVANWKIEDAGGLDVRINNTNDSLLYNTERTDAEKLIYRELGATLLTHTLDDNATNYVEVELFTSTTAEDSVAIWDQSANGGDGEEFIQNVDTVTCTEPRIVSNTIQFSVGQPQRVRLAVVTTVGGVITNISDGRQFLWNLASDWDFDGTAFGTVRTDKTIQTLKNMYDAVTTSLKELKDTTNWYDPPGISPIDLLERMNYMLVDGGNISWNLPKAAVGHLIADRADVITGIVDGDTFTIDDGQGNVVVFTFDTDASGPANPVTLPTDSEDETVVRDAIVAAINASVLQITATPGLAGRVELVNDNIGTSGNVAITEGISNGSSLSPFGMEGGFDDNELTWSLDLHIIAPSRAYEYTIDAQTVSGMADGEVAYVTLPTEGAAPGGSLTVSVVDSASYPLDFANTRNYIIGYRSGNKMYFGNGYHGVELEDGETSQLGDGITSQWITATGLVDEFDSTPPYWSTHWITPDSSFTDALSSHDQVIEDIYNMVIGAPYDERVTLGAPLTTGSFVTLPPAFGVGPNQTYQTDINQLEVFFNGRKVKRGEDWDESANVGAGIGNRIETLIDLPTNLNIDFRIQIGGGQDGTITADAPGASYEGSLIVDPVTLINWRDDVEIINTGGGVIDVRVRRSRQMGRVCVNNAVGAIPAGSVVAWADDGSVVLADANVVTLSDLVGITEEIIAGSGGTGFVAREGLVEGVAAGLAIGPSDPVPGTPIYLGEVPGTLTVTPPPLLTDTVIMMGRAEPPAGLDGTGTALWLHPEIIAEA